MVRYRAEFYAGDASYQGACEIRARDLVAARKFAVRKARAHGARSAELYKYTYDEFELSDEQVSVWSEDGGWS